MLKKSLASRVRYLTDIAVEGRPAEDTMIISHEEGPSARYICQNCEESFESIRMDNHDPAECPKCSEICEKPSQPNVVFPRVTWEDGNQVIDIGSLDYEIKEIADPVGDVSLGFGTNIPDNAMDNIAKLQARAEAEAKEALEKLGEAPELEKEDDELLEQFEAISFKRTVPTVPEISAEEKRKRQKARLMQAIAQKAKPTRSSKPMPEQQIRIFYEGLQEDATASVETMIGRIEDLRTTADKLRNGSRKAIEAHAKISQGEQGELEARIREAEARVEKARDELAKLTAAHNKLLENAEYLKVDQESYIQKLNKEATKLQAEIDAALDEAKKEVDGRKFMITKIVDGTERTCNQLITSGQGNGDDIAYQLQDACEYLLRIISQQYMAVAEVDEKIELFRDWSRQLNSQAKDSDEDAPQRPEPIPVNNSSIKAIHPPDVSKVLPAANVDSGWYYMDGRSEVGPLDIEALKELFRSKILHGHSLVRKADSSLAAPATTFPELRNGVGEMSGGNTPGIPIAPQTSQASSISGNISDQINLLMLVFLCLFFLTVIHGAVQLSLRIISPQIHLVINLTLAASCLVGMSIGYFYIHTNNDRLSSAPSGVRLSGIVSILGMGVCLIMAACLAYMSQGT